MSGCMNVDQYGRTIDYLRISVTDLCNLRCQYCMPEDGICEKLPHEEILRIEEIIKLVKVAAQEGVRKIRLTGGEPLIRRGIVELVGAINEIEGIEEIGMTTNGILLSKYASDLKEAGLTRVNVSIDTLDSSKFAQMTRGGDLSQVMAGLHAAAEVGLKPIKVNTVLIGGFNNHEVDAFMTLAKKYDLLWRVIELMPIGEVSEWSSTHFISGAKLFDEDPNLIRLHETDSSRVKQFYNEALGITIGLIDALSGKFCSSCNRLRLTADGKIKPCLHSDTEYDVKPYLDDEEALRDFYRSCVHNKPKEHGMLEEHYQPIKRNMNRIGG